MIRKLLFLTFFLLALVGSAQTYDTLSVYFALGSHDIMEESIILLEKYDDSSEAHISAVRLEAHCDVRGSSVYNDTLAKNRIKSVKMNLQSYGWKTSNAREVIHSISVAQTDPNYKHDDYRRVDIFLKVKPISPAQKLTLALEQFVTDTSETKRIDLPILFFDGSTNMRTESIIEAKVLRDFLALHPTIYLELYGHVCCDDNYPLSLGRANAVKDFLLYNENIYQDRLTTFGRSNHNPKISPERTEADRVQNRRVTAVFKKTVQ